MGRKIPGKRHRGVKDPEKQKIKRLKSLKGKINAPPLDPDTQEVPHSVSRIAELKEKYKGRNTLARERRDFSSIKKQRRKRDSNFAFKQGKRESDRQFLNRVRKACDSAIQQSVFENKYNVRIKRNTKTGEVEELVKKPEDELDLMLHNARRRQKLSGKKSLNPITDKPKQSKSQKRHAKLRDKLQQKKTESHKFYHDTDTVEFGEVVHEPPTLSVPRKATRSNSNLNPGRSNLLLKAILHGPTQANALPKNNGQCQQKIAGKTLDKTAKRKNLPNALRRQLDKQQMEIIDAYRTLKKKKNASH